MPNDNNNNLSKGIKMSSIITVGVFYSDSRFPGEDFVEEVDYANTFDIENVCKVVRSWYHGIATQTAKESDEHGHINIEVGWWPKGEDSNITVVGGDRIEF